MTEEYIQRLEEIASLHLNPHPVHLVDRLIQKYDTEKLLPHVHGPRVLELGYGDGTWTERLIQRYGISYVVDGSKKLLDHAKQLHGEKIYCFNSLFEDFEPPDGLLFNTIVATHILEHVDDPIVVLQRCRKWLAFDGIILIIVPNATSLHRELAVMMGIQKTIYDLSLRDVEVGHQRVYDLSLLRRHVIEAGYDILTEKGLLLKLLPYNMMTNFSEDLLKAMVDISDRLPVTLMANLVMVIKPKDFNSFRRDSRT